MRTCALSLTVRRRGPGTVVVQLSGPLDADAAEDLDRLLAEMADQGERNVVIDLARLGATGEIGMRALVAGRVALARQGGSLTILSPAGATFEMLESAGLGTVARITG